MTIDLEALTDHVTEALYESVRPDGEGWDDLSADDQADIREGAVVAIKATTAWFSANGVQVLPPNTFKQPECREEAEAMAAAGMAWLRTHPAKLVRVSDLTGIK